MPACVCVKVRVWVCVCVKVRVCESACMGVRVLESVRVRVRVCMSAYHVCVSVCLAAAFSTRVSEPPSSTTN